MKIAVIGAGIAGLASAYTLSRRHEVTVFEADHRLRVIPTMGRGLAEGEDLSEPDPGSF